MPISECILCFTSSISDCDLRMITHDIQQFCTHLAAIYANLAKPVLDVILYNYQLAQNVGGEGLILLTILVQGSAALREPYLP
jgi:ATP-binding cassette, subfamily D (ALD), peroxisomal long-chain fatty acid import protein